MAGYLVITGKETAPGFRLAGIECIEADERTDVAGLLTSIVDEGRYGLVCIEDRFFKRVPSNVMRRIEKKGFPVVVPVEIPLEWGEKEAGESPIARLIRRAIGYQIKLKR